MVNDILDFSRLEANTELEKEQNNIEKLIEECAKQATRHNLKITIEKQSTPPEFMFNYDSIERALTNYLSNAIKYSPENGEIKISLSYSREKNEVEVAVTY